MGEENSRSIENYIISARRKGVEDTAIKEKLLKAGFFSDEIESVLLKLDKDRGSKRTVIIPENTNKKDTDIIQKDIIKKEENKENIPIEKAKVRRPLKVPKYIWIIIGGVILSIVIISIIFILQTMGKCDEACFIEKANECKHEDYTFVSDEATYYFETDTDCSILKRITEVGEDEPQEVKDLFLDKDMICYYDKGDFPKEILTDITFTGDCFGELHDNVQVLMMLVE